MALQSSRARWRKPLNLAALPSHAESPSVLLPRHQSSVSQVSVSQVPAQASFTLRLLLSTFLLLRTAGTHAQNRQGSQGDQLRHLHLRATCTCAPSACSSSSRKGRSRSRSSCGGSACSRTRERAARRRPVDLGMPFLQGFVFHMVPVRVKSNYYSFYRLGSASETVRRCATAAPPPTIALSLSFSTVRRFSRTFSCSFGFRYAEMRCHEHPVARPRSTSAVYSLLFVRALLPSWYHGFAADETRPDVIVLYLRGQDPHPPYRSQSKGCPKVGQSCSTSRVLSLLLGCSTF